MDGVALDGRSGSSQVGACPGLSLLLVTREPHNNWVSRKTVTEAPELRTDATED